jgi:hypothetical protein
MLSINKDTVYSLYFPEDKVDMSFQMKGSEIYEAIRYNIPRKKIKDIHSSLAKAVEQGSEINLGIVIGQVLCMLNELKDGN